jgi:hypothetical protein
VGNPGFKKVKQAFLLPNVPEYVTGYQARWVFRMDYQYLLKPVSELPIPPPQHYFSRDMIDLEFSGTHSLIKAIL